VSLRRSQLRALRGIECNLADSEPYLDALFLSFVPTASDARGCDGYPCLVHAKADRDGHVHLACKATNDVEATGLYHELRKLLNHVGIAAHHVLDKNFYMSMDVPVAGVAHCVVDTSFLPSIGAVNPAVTAMANAIRVGAHLLSRMS
jgi:hypothetical protein